MLRSKILTIPILVFCLLNSCSSPKKSFENGNYESAYSSALKNLKKGSKKREDKSILNKSFNEILEQQKYDYDKYLRSDIIEDWELAYETYESLLDRYDEGKRYLDNSYDSEMNYISNEFDTLGLNIAENYFAIGNMSLEDYKLNGDKIMAQDAFIFFEKAEEYNPHLADINTLKHFAFDAGVIYVLIETRGSFGHGHIIDNVFREAERYSAEFMNINHNRNLREVDCILEVVFSKLDRDLRESQERQTYTEEVEDGFDTRIDTSGNQIQVPKYRTIEAELLTIREELIYSFDVRVNDRSSTRYCDFRYRSYQEEEVVIREYYEVNGDTDAIPSSINWRNQNRDVIYEDEIAERLIERLYDDIERDYLR